MDDMIKVEGHESLVRDKQTFAIVNTDREALLAARARKKRIIDEREKIEDLQEKVARLESIVEKLLGNKK